MVVKERLESNRSFKIHSDFKPSGDQPNAIKELVSGINSSERNQVLLGATGTGKTFTIAHVIEQTQRPAVILAPNKTLAAQLYGEFKTFFQIMLLNILFLFMTIINQKLTFLDQILTLKKMLK